MLVLGDKLDGSPAALRDGGVVLQERRTHYSVTDQNPSETVKKTFDWSFMALHGLWFWFWLQVLCFGSRRSQVNSQSHDDDEETVRTLTEPLV